MSKNEMICGSRTKPVSPRYFPPAIAFLPSAVCIEKGMNDMLEKNEIEQLDKAWVIIRIIWGVLMGSLAVYLLVGISMKDQLKPMGAGFPIETLKIVLFAMSILTFFIIYFIRKAMLQISISGSASPFMQNASTQIQNPAAGKYLYAIIVAMALSESMGVYGLVLFFLSKDPGVLYQFIVMSAISMFYYRPRKEELLQLAVEMNKLSGEKRI
jgi:hypothetical protein